MDSIAFLRRFPAYIIDILMIIFLIWSYAHVFGQQEKTGGYTIKHEYGVPVIALLAHGYYILQEFFLGTTIGKRILKLKVIKLNGGKLTFTDVLLRNSMNTVEVFLFPIIAMTAILVSRKRQRLGDMIAKTTVVDKSV